MTTQERNKGIIRQVIEFYNEGNREAAHNLLSEDCEILDWTGKLFKRNEFIQVMEEFVSAFPDFHLTIEDLMAESDKVSARLTETGTMKGNFMGMEATGKKINYPAIEIYRLANGKVTAIWTVRDILTAGIQMGMFPEMEQQMR